MNWKPMGALIGLRYKLMWAKTRSRGGKIALAAIGFLLAVLLAGVLTAGGVGAGILAIRSGQAERMAQAVLSHLFVTSVVGSLLLGFGMNSVFADAELRRFPLRERERFGARHFLGMADPFWLFVLALEAGLVVGLYVCGTYSFWYGAAAVMLLFVCGYLLTRLLGVWIERLMSTRSGSMVAVGLIMVLSLAPGTLTPILRKQPSLQAGILGVLQYSPPFAAAAAMTHQGAGAFPGLGLIAAWAVCLVAALVALERRPIARRQSARTAGVTWNGPLDRAAALFGPRMAPLVAHWLRFYLRNNRFRILYPFSLVLAAFLTYNIGLLLHVAGGLFVAALGGFPVVAFLGTSRIAVNQYGYVGGAFRRFFLFPTDPAASLRAGSYAAVLLSAAMIPPAAILWAAFAPRPLDPRVALMPAMNAVTVLFWFHGAGLWTSLYGPRRGDYDKALGNDLSLLGNIVFMGTVFACVALPMVLGPAVSPEDWWLTLPPAALAVAFYVASLRGASMAFLARRERLLAVLEGKA
jgi:hypothetical protein